MLEQNQKLVQGMRDTLDNVAHDLRTPIMRLQNSIEGALSGNEAIPIYKDALIDCQENSEMLLQLLNGIMDISEAEAGTLKLNREPLNSSQIIESVIDLYGFVAEDKGITISTDVRQPFSFVGDRVRVLQAVSNILDNALKYSPSGSKVLVQSTVEGQSGTISVFDQGIGIPSNEMHRIWERLYRVDASRASKGLGLGLSLVRAIVTAHEGEVGVRANDSSAGSIFFIKFKQSDASAST